MFTIIDVVFKPIDTLACRQRNDIAISSYPSMLYLFVDSLFEFGVVKYFVYHARITAILNSDLFSCMSL